MDRKTRAKRRMSLVEIAVEKTLLICASISIVVVGLIFAFLVSQGGPVLFEISMLEFLSGTSWQPTSSIKPDFGILPLVYGTLLVTTIAMAIAVPLGIAAASYISEVAKPLEREILKPVLELLAGVPSVVYGFFALTTLATWIQQLTGTHSRLNAMNGGIILAVMALPTITSLAEDALTAVPREYKEASIALGASRWETLRSVLIPSSSRGILAATLLGFGRVIGETMAVLMATGNAAIINYNLLDSARTITATIAIETPEVAFGSTHYHVLFALAIVLFLMTFGFNYLAGVVMKRIGGDRA